MVAYVRQCGTDAAAHNPYPVPEQALADIRKLLLDRVQTIDPNEEASLKALFDMRLDEWRRWERNRYSGSPSDEELPLMRPAGAYANPEHLRISWATPQSLRSVDAQCQVEITTLYLNDPAVPNA
jgi:hypothetical protein